MRLSVRTGLYPALAIFLCVLLALAHPAYAQFTETEGMLDTVIDGERYRLHAMTVRAQQPGRLPLAIIAHGSPRNADDRPKMVPSSYLDQARAFAAGGYHVVAVMRRGYGKSEGRWADSGPCDRRNYTWAGRTEAADLRGVIERLRGDPMVDASRILLVGHSAGGFAALALANDPPAGLVGIVSFGGGRGSNRPRELCSEQALMDAYRTYGNGARTPSIWLYAENDLFFIPDVVRDLHAAYTRAGAAAELVWFPPFRTDGHVLFTRRGGFALWRDPANRFLAARGLPSVGTIALPQIAPPAGLSEKARQVFTEDYLDGGHHRAFATGSGSRWGWASGRMTPHAARNDALNFCEGRSNEVCRVIAVDDDMVP